MPLKTGELTDQHHRTLASEDISRNYLVEAGAGTGKTTILVKKFTRLITEGIPIDEIIAITFTEKATAEMITRIRDSLEEIYIKEQNDLILKERCRVALEDFNLNRISTIHSFSSSILKEKPFNAGVDPFFDVNDDFCWEIFQQTWDEWSEKEIELEDSSIKSAIEAGVGTDYLFSLAQYIYNNRDFFADYSPIITSPDISEFIETLNKTAAELNSLFENYCRSKEDASWDQLTRLNRLVSRLTHKTDQEKEQLILNYDSFKGKGNQKNWGSKDACKNQKETFKQLDEELRKIKSEISEKILNHCIVRIKEFLKQVEKEKFNNSVLDFQDLLIKARNLLRDDISVRKYFKNKIRYILVDEFQDTDPLQAEIVFFLAEMMYRKTPDLIDISGSQATPREESMEWDQCRLPNGRLFIVGDPKQSIYRFRRADIEIYEKVKSLIKENDGDILNISVNFRSIKPVVDWVNEHFSRVIKKPEDGNYQSGYTPLNPNRTGEKGTPALFMLKVDENVQETLTKTPYVRRAEAAVVAEFINNTVKNSQYEILERDGSRHKVTYKDFAILFPKTTDIDIYEEALASRDIPYLLEAGRNFFGRSEIIDIISILKAIDNPCDEIAVVATLKSPICGVSDNEILAVTLKGGTFNYLEKNDSLPESIEDTFEKLRDYYNTRGEFTVSGLIEEILNWSDYREYCIITTGKDRSLANIEKLLSIAREFENNRRGSLRGFIQEIDKKISDEESEADAPLAESDSNAVMMLTMHKSKGLEFPIVIPVNMGTRKSSQGKGNFYIDREHNLFEAEMNIIKTPGLDKMKELEKKRLEAEEARLIYVACTRAKNMLVLPCIPVSQRGKLKFNGMQKHLVDTYSGDIKEINEMFRYKVYHEDNLATGKAAYKTIPGILNQSIEDQDENLMESIKTEAVNFKEALLNYEENLQHVIKKASRSKAVKSYSSEKKKDEISDSVEEDDTGLKIGRAYHSVMENINFVNPKNLKQVVDTACINEGISQEKQTVYELSERTLKSPVIATAIRSGRYRREVPFSLDIDGEACQGYIDLAVRWKKGYIIVDYKSDNISKEQIPDVFENQYKTQASLYKKAIEKITRKPVERIIYYFASPDVAFEVNI